MLFAYVLIPHGRTWVGRHRAGDARVARDGEAEGAAPRAQLLTGPRRPARRRVCGRVEPTGSRVGCVGWDVAWRRGVYLA